MPPPGNWGTLSPPQLRSWEVVQRETTEGQGLRVILSSALPFTAPRKHTHIPGPAKGLCWSRHGRMRRWPERRRPESVCLVTGDRVTIQSPSSPECAPCVEGHRPGGGGMEGPWDPRNVVPCRGPRTARSKGGLLGTRLLPSWLATALPAPEIHACSARDGPPPQHSLSDEGCRADGCIHSLLLTACLLVPGVKSSVPLCSFEGHSHWIPFSTYISVSEHFSCSLRVESSSLSAVCPGSLCCPCTSLSCIPRFLFTNYHAALLLSRFPATALSTSVSLQLFPDLCTYLYYPVCMHLFIHLCVDVSVQWYAHSPGQLCICLYTWLISYELSKQLLIYVFIRVYVSFFSSPMFQL